MQERLPSSTTTVLRTLVVAAFVVILNETLLVNALPQLMESLDIDERAAQWLTTGFMLTLAVVIPTTGWLLKRLGVRSAYRLAMVLFLLGTTAAALAPTFPLLLAGRVVQASGTAIMMPLLMTTLMELVPPHTRGRVMGNVTLTIAVAPALGPAVSGVVLQWLEWRWLFGLVLPIALVVTLVGLRALKAAEVSDPTGPRPRLDALSVLLTAVGFGFLVYGLAEAGGESGAGANPFVAPWIALLVGAAGLALFVWRQLALQRSGSPLLDLRVLRRGQYTVALLLGSVAFMSMMGLMILLPLYLQQVRGLSVLQAGLLLMPGGLIMGLLGPQVGRWFDKVGGRPLVVPGALVLLVSLCGMAAATLFAPWWPFLVGHVTASVGLALMMTPAFTGGLGALPPSLYSFGSALLGTVQQVAAAIGTAMAIAVLSWRQGNLLGDGATADSALDGGVRAALMVGIGLGVVVVVISTFVRSAPGREVAEPGAEPAGPTVSDEPELSTHSR
ncbi:MDR family MFS transporter [Ornithinimicrobium humiphilum]|uniref:DHA2 family lincomycin resistance protein-like MFS transporter n=1 Tax=Ornithinimicrobium humiphilum TaxID=125288 RepID=A0A543KPX8_9MICO|nr:DHA2 family efflux MFS transporter permease subunit [Ornithinimicrobium humiphilum]TQM97118.1 DHA2 family lincomycin resistance protein-like MFS transporter [Ornithinimicrobium humiphilum]